MVVDILVEQAIVQQGIDPISIGESLLFPFAKAPASPDASGLASTVATKGPDVSSLTPVVTVTEQAAVSDLLTLSFHFSEVALFFELSSVPPFLCFSFPPKPYCFEHAGNFRDYIAQSTHQRGGAIRTDKEWRETAEAPLEEKLAAAAGVGECGEQERSAANFEVPFAS